MTTSPEDSSHTEENYEELRLDEQRLLDFAEAASDWFFEMDKDLRFSYVSARHREVIGVLPEQVIGKTRWDAHQSRRLPEEEANWQKHIKTMRAHKDWKDFTYTLIRDDGERRIISNSAKAIFDENGSFAGYRGVGRDVTDQLSAETRLNSILDAIPDAIITIDQNGIINSFSQTAEILFGYSAAEVIGQNVKLLMPSPYREEHDGYIDHYKTTGEKRIIGIGREVEAQRKDGSVFPINLSVNEMLIDGKRMFTGVVHDTTELKEAQSLNARIGKILDQSLNEIFVFDAETLNFIQVNFGARNNLGYSSHELHHLTPFDIKPEFTQQQFEQVLAPLRQGDQEQLIFKTIHQRKDGTTYPVEVHLQLMSKEKPPVFAAIIQDITEIERREAHLRQSQKMEAIGQLTGGIAHDFNNLLTVIIGNNELLAEFLKDDFQRGLLDDSTSAAEHAAQLTGQLLAFARQQPLDPQIIQINDLVEDMKDMLSRTLGENIKLQTALAPEVRMTLVDPAQVHNAVLNLAINARDAMQDGGDLIIETSNADIDADSALMRSDATPGRFVRLSVRDTGTGMSPEIQARILEPFFTTKDQGKGTGLGLSMVHGFAKQSGGFMEIYSEIDYGTSISLYLPDADNETDAADDQEAEIQKKNTDKTILVVEDDPRVRTITVKRLEFLGYRTLEAESGQNALHILAQTPGIDLVFSDMVMPGGMTGGELLDQVQKTYPGIKRLITSGYAEDGIMPNHGTKWLRKPYSIQEMANTFSDILD